MSKKVTAIGFDLDGVLINSLPSMQKAWGEVNSKCDVDTPFAAYESYIGFPFKDILTFLNLSDRYEEIFSIYFDATKKYSHLVEIYPGVLDVLGILRDKQVPLFIVTSKPRIAASALLHNLNIKVDLLVCPEDVLRGKPHIESALLVKQQLNLCGSRIIFVGDMPVDREFATKSEFVFCYASYGYGRDELAPTSTELIISSPSELLKVLDLT